MKVAAYGISMNLANRRIPSGKGFSVADSVRIPPKVGKKWRADWKACEVIASSKAQRLALVKRDGGMCCKCKALGKPWHAEHSFTLELVNRGDYPNCLKYWSMEYLETVCVGCHAPKTKREAKARA